MFIKNKKLLILSIFLIAIVAISAGSAFAADIQDDTNGPVLADSDILSDGQLGDDPSDSGTNDGGDDPTNPGTDSGGEGGDTPDPQTTPKETNLTVTADSITVGSDAQIDFNLKDCDGADLDGTVSFTFGDDEAQDFTLTDGTYSHIISGLAIGKYNYVANFAGNEDYAPSTASGTLEVLGVKSILNLTVKDIHVGENAIIGITLTDSDGGNINGPVNLTIGNNEPISITLADGTYSYTFANPAAGTYPIAVAFEGDNTYAACKATATLKVEKIKTNLSVTASKITAGNDATIKIALTDTNGNKINGVVALTVNGKTYNISVNNGQASKTLSGLAVKTYPISAKYAGDSTYLGSSASASLVVDPTKVSSFSQLKSAVSNANTKHIQLTKNITVSSVIEIKNHSPLIIDGNGYTINGNGHGIFSIYGTTTTIKNLIMKGAKAVKGSAIYSSSSKLTISNCQFNSNVATGDKAAGAAIYSTGGSLSVTGTKFTSNVANTGRGGAVAVATNNASFNKCTFTSNKVKNGQGGAIAVYNKGIKITSCTFKSNSATATGKAYGGALDLMAANPNIQSSTFTGNSAKNHAGAILVSQDVVGAVINKCTFTSNKANAEDGGAIAWAGGKGSLTNCKFTSNYAKQDGGCIDFFDQVRKTPPTITIKNCVFNKNKSQKSAAAVFLGVKIKFVLSNCNFTSNSKPKYGGAVFFEGTSASFSNCNFKSNVASQNGGAISANSGGKISLTKCTFTGNKAYFGGAILNKAKGITVNSCKFTKNTAGRSGGAIAIQGGTNVIKVSTFLSNKGVYGGAIFQGSGKLTLTKNTFTSNIASKYGGGAFIAGGKFTQSGNKFKGNKGGKKPNIHKK